MVDIKGIDARKGIEDTFEHMERYIATCDKDTINYAINIGRMFPDLDTKDLERLFIITEKWHRNCNCKKSVIVRKDRK